MDKRFYINNQIGPTLMTLFFFIIYRRRASPGQYMIFVTFLSVSLNFRKFFELRLNKDWSDYETTSLMEYPPYIVFSNTWQELVVTGALPFLVLLFCNISIYLKIRESSKHESHRFVGKYSCKEDDERRAKSEGNNAEEAIALVDFEPNRRSRTLR